jgi:hypothetical protein
MSAFGRKRTLLENLSLVLVGFDPTLFHWLSCHPGAAQFLIRKTSIATGGDFA